MNSIIKFSLENKYLVLLVSLIVIVYGYKTAVSMDIDVFPDLTAPTVVIMTDAHGMASEDVERVVTVPIETMVNGATDVRRIRSVSANGFSFVWVEFDWGTNILTARQIVNEKINGMASKLPIGVGQPVLAPQSSVMGEIIFISMQSDSTSLMDLRTIAEWQVRPVILSTGGVSQVTILGGEYKQYQVVVNPELMKNFNVSFNEIIEASKNLSNNSSGGVLREHGNEYILRGVAKTNDINELGNTLIKNVDGKPLTINDVAEITIGAATKMGYASENAKPAVILSVSKQPNANTLDVTKKIETNLNKLNKTLPADIKVNTKIFRQADFIETSVDNVIDVLIEGGIFVIIVLFMFLGSFRTTIISLLAIPLSLLGTIIVLHLLGLNINTMSLGGMAIAIGSLVDDAIIDVENVYKRLKQNHLKLPEEKKPIKTIVYEASLEIRSSIFNATLIIIVTFLPLFFLSGMEGRMLKPLGLAFVVSLFISLIVAMTVTPLMSQLLLSNSKYLEKNKEEKLIVRKMLYFYEKSLQRAIENKKKILVFTIAVLVFSLFIFSTLGRSFLPEFNEGALTISVVTLPGSSLEESNNLGSIVERELKQIKEITSTSRRTGRGELDEHSQTSNSSEIDVNFKLNDKSRDEFMSEVRTTLSSIPGITYTVGQPLGHRIDHMLSGTRANIAIKIFGPDISKMYMLGNNIKSKIEKVEGLVDINVEQQINVPQIQINANRQKLIKYGISIKDFNEFIEVAFGNEKLADIYEGMRNFDLVIKLDKNNSGSLEGIKNTYIDTYDGKKIPLEEIAEIKSVTGPSSISRENAERKLVVSANVAGRDLRSVMDDIQQIIKDEIKTEEGYRIEYGGQFESEQSASRTLLFTSILSLFIIFFLLYHEFKNVKLSLLILINLPLSLIGGVLTVWLTSGVLSIPSIIGFITLFGVATRNGILLVSNYQRLSNLNYSLNDIVLKGSTDRLNAIIMTALTAALALIPLAFKGDLAGNEIQSPMAVVILGGLITSTFLNVYIIPIVYSLFYKSLNKGVEL
jgi:CzcA family heavy metal efflux pump